MRELVSVLIPVFNIEAYIGKCIESVIQQTYTDIEIIIVDDGSVDESGIICKQFAEKDSRIIYVYQENKGSVGARKTGLIYAKGKYIVFVDGDDYVERDYVERLYEFIFKEDVDFVYSNYMVNGKKHRFIKRVHLYRKRDLNFDFRIRMLRNYIFEWDAEKEVVDCNLYGCIYKKNVIYDCFMKLPDSQQYGEDILCFCNLFMECESMMFIPNAYYHYVIREGSLDHQQDFMVALSNKISLYENVEKVLKGYKIFSELSDKLQMFFIHKIFWDFRLISSKEIQINKKYSCEFTELLIGKKVVLYGAGVVGQSIYKQLSNFEGIEIAAWVDHNYRNIHSPYRHISDPELIHTLDFDYVVIAVEKKNIAEEIADYLFQKNIEKKSILWQSYPKRVSLSMQENASE